MNRAEFLGFPFYFLFSNLVQGITEKIYWEAVIHSTAVLLLAMTLQYDRNGIPQYTGDPAVFEEYEERVWDLYHGRTLQEQKAATAVHLRAGLQGAAYDAVRNLKHDQLVTHTVDDEGTPTSTASDVSHRQATR